MVTYKGVCEKLGFDLDEYNNKRSNNSNFTENDVETPEDIAFRNLNDEELDFIIERGLNS